MARHDISNPRTSLERSAARRARRIRTAIGSDIQIAREDAGLSLSRLAGAAGLSKSYLHAIEAGSKEPRTEPLARIAAVLGMDLSVRLYPGTGPLIRDHIQAAMISALLEILHERWRPALEVAVQRPVRGVIDLALYVVSDIAAVDEPIVACEAHSELRRLEQQIRWSGAKADALSEAHGRRTSRLLLLRSTVRTRAVVTEYAAVVAAAYPASTRASLRALSTDHVWPGDALLWCRVDSGNATVMARPPRGVPVGR